MKLILGIALALSSLTAVAQQRVVNERDLNRDMAICERECSSYCSRFVSRLNRRLDNMAYNCGYDQPAPMPPIGQKVKFYNDDSCSRDYLGSVSSQRDCNTFAKNVNSSVWTVEIDGQCLNIDDTTAIKACRAFTNARLGRAVELYYDDNCYKGALGLIDRNTNCSQFAANVDKDVWAIKVNGRCMNITDVSAESACNLYKNEY